MLLRRRSPRSPVAVTLLAALASLAGLAGCATTEPASVPTVTVYTSLPHQGAQRTLSEGIRNGVRLALAQADDRAGQFTVRLHSLDDATGETGKWDPGQTSANARRAAADPSAVAYLGEFNSGASAISIPILNEAGLAQVSPGNTAVGLTSADAGADVGEPGKYYPTERRTYLRVVPRDTVQGAAIAQLMHDQACERVFILHDAELYGVGLALNITASAQPLGLTLVGSQVVDPKASNYRDVAADLARQGVDCAVFAGITPNNAVQVFRDLAAGLPDATLFGSDGVAESSFADPTEGGVPASAAERIWITAPTLDAANYPPAGQQFFADYREAYGDRTPEPYAIYGYEAMRLVLDAIAAAGERGDDRAAVVDELMRTRDRESVLGTYSIDANGDTTLTDYGAYRILDGRLAFDHVIRR